MLCGYTSGTSITPGHASVFRPAISGAAGMNEGEVVPGCRERYRDRHRLDVAHDLVALVGSVPSFSTVGPLLVA